MINITNKNSERNFMIYFYGRGSTALSLQSHYEERVYFLQTTTVYFLPNTKSLTHPGTHLIDLRRMKGWVSPPCSQLVVLNPGRMNWEFNALTTTTLLKVYVKAEEKKIW